MPNPLFEARLDELDIAVFDLETTGLFPSLDRIIQIALVPVTAGQIEDDAHHREWKVNPGEDYLPLEEIVRELTGLDADILRDAPSIDETLPEFAAAVAAALVGYEPGGSKLGYDLPRGKLGRRDESSGGFDKRPSSGDDQLGDHRAAGDHADQGDGE